MNRKLSLVFIKIVTQDEKVRGKSNNGMAQCRKDKDNQRREREEESKRKLEEKGRSLKKGTMD